MPRQPPLAPSLLQLRFGFGARPAPGWRGCPRCAGCASLAFPMPRCSVITVPCPVSLRYVPAVCPVSQPRVPAARPVSPQHARGPCIPACGWHGCPLSGLRFGSSAPPGLPKVAVVNALVGHCGFTSAPSPWQGRGGLCSPEPTGVSRTASKLGACAGRTWGLRRVATAARHVAPWPGSPAPSSPRDVEGG